MRYFDRKLLFPAMAVTAWAQQPSPATAEAEAALRARAEQFFQLQVDKKYRPAEAMVADDTKDLYYNGKKFNISSFSIEKIELLDDNTRARLTVKAKVTRAIPGFGFVDFDAPAATLWKLENGQWVYYVDQAATVQTPFGPVQEQKGAGKDAPPTLSKVGKAPDISTLQSMVKIDRNAVDLSPDSQTETVTVTNDLPGGVDLELQYGKVPGVSVELEKKHLEAGEKTVIHFRATSAGKAVGLVHVTVSPIGAQLDIHVNVN
jgi:hypothetical protein